MTQENKETTAAENKVVAYRFEVIRPVYETTPDGKKTQNGTHTDVYYHVKEWYAKDELDWGNYWDFGEGSVYPYTSDGSVHDDIHQTYEWMDVKLPNGYSMEIIESKLSHHGDFIEFSLSEGVVLRATAIGERPRLVADKFICDCGILGQSMIKVYGKPLASDRVVSSKNHIWRKDSDNWILSLIRSSITVKDAVIEFGNGGIYYDEGENFCVGLIVTANSVEDLKAVMRDLGADRIDDSRICTEYVSGNTDTGERRVFAKITVSASPY